MATTLLSPRIFHISSSLQLGISVPLHTHPKHSRAIELASQSLPSVKRRSPLADTQPYALQDSSSIVYNQSCKASVHGSLHSEELLSSFQLSRTKHRARSHTPWRKMTGLESIFFKTRGQRSPRNRQSLIHALRGESDKNVDEVGDEVTSTDEHRSSQMVLPTGCPVLSTPDPSTNPWDGNGAASPAVVELPSDSGKVYRMYYYGRPGSFLGCGVSAGPLAALPFGWIGCAESSDGIHWSRVKGEVNPPGGAGAVFGPSEVLGSFDSVAVGVGDAIRRPDGSIWLYYFGYDTAKESPTLGFSIGLATSTDGGMTFSRPAGPILEPGSLSEWDSTFVAWPKVLPPEQSGDKWIMTYHAMSSPPPALQYAVGVAISEDGKKWEKVSGPVLSSGAPGTFDSAGIGTRHVIKADGRFLMFYDGLSFVPEAKVPFLYQIGIAESKDGVHWEKCIGVGKDPGGPVLSPGKPGAWDDLAVGTPHVCLEGSQLRLYYVGRGEGKSQIGLAFGSLEDLSKWRKYGDSSVV